jgi:hypothetical protein
MIKLKEKEKLGWSIVKLKKQLYKYYFIYFVGVADLI